MSCPSAPSSRDHPQRDYSVVVNNRSRLSPRIRYDGKNVLTYNAIPSDLTLYAKLGEGKDVPNHPINTYFAYCLRNSKGELVEFYHSSGCGGGSGKLSEFWTPCTNKSGSWCVWRYQGSDLVSETIADVSPELGYSRQDPRSYDVPEKLASAPRDTERQFSDPDY